MIQVKVRVFATLRSYLPELAIGQPLALDLPPASTIGDVLDRLGIPHEKARICFVNGVKRELTDCLAGGDELAIFPPIAGG